MTQRKFKFPFSVEHCLLYATGTAPYLTMLMRRFLDRRAYRDWLKAGKPLPPPHIVKQLVVKGYQTRFGMRIFVETGTYLGDMIAAVERSFDLVYSIELSKELYETARKRFARRRHINILQGDSAEALSEVLAKIEEPCLFWLDGHWSGGITARGAKITAIGDEMNCVLGHGVRGHVILIDDARCFTGLDDFPTVEQLREKADSTGIYDSFEVRDDIIRIH